MFFLSFAIFFAFNFSLWYMMPALLFRNITKVSHKKKKKYLKTEFLTYIVLSILYIVSFYVFYRLFSIAIEESYNGSSIINYFSSNINALSFINVFFLIVSLTQGIFSFIFVRKLFQLEKINLGYVIVSITGLINVVSYFISNALLKLNLYMFDAENYLMNLILKFNYSFGLFIFPGLVFITFALSFIEEE